MNGIHLSSACVWAFVLSMQEEKWIVQILVNTNLDWKPKLGQKWRLAATPSGEEKWVESTKRLQPCISWIMEKALTTRELILSLLSRVTSDDVFNRKNWWILQQRASNYLRTSLFRVLCSEIQALLRLQFSQNFQFVRKNIKSYLRENEQNASKDSHLIVESHLKILELNKKWGQLDESKSLTWYVLVSLRSWNTGR